MLHNAIARTAAIRDETLVLDEAQRGAIRVGKLDCPARERSFGERLAGTLRSLLRAQPSWFNRPLANPKLEALRLLMCLQLHPDEALREVVLRELRTEFTGRQIELLSAFARRPLR